MKLLIFSDSHYRTEPMYSVAEKYSSVIDGIIHLGDCTEDISGFKTICPDIHIYNVRGNNDYENGCPAERTVPIAGHTIFMTHGHRQRVYYNTDTLYYTAAQNGADIALFGHTHVPYLQNENGILIMNPGSISLPRSSVEKSFAFLTFENRKAEAVIMKIGHDGISKLASLSF